MLSKVLGKAKERQAADATPPRPEQGVRAPAVNIYDTDQSIVIVADMPGVTRDSVDITMDHDVLTLRGAVAPDTHTGFRLVHGEYRVANFERSLTMPPEIDVEHVEASVTSGVVTVTLPKNKAVQARRIAVKPG